MDTLNLRRRRDASITISVSIALSPVILSAIVETEQVLAEAQHPLLDFVPPPSQRTHILPTLQRRKNNPQSSKRTG